MNIVKCQKQGGDSNELNLNISQRLRCEIKEQGRLFALYRGISPGSLRSFVGNGSAMAVVIFLQRIVSERVLIFNLVIYFVLIIIFGLIFRIKLL